LGATNLNATRLIVPFWNGGAGVAVQVTGLIGMVAAPSGYVTAIASTATPISRSLIFILSLPASLCPLCSGEARGCSFGPCARRAPGGIR
jgi:hypothetical protein